MKRVYLSRRDGAHVFVLGLHLHVFLWTRGHKRLRWLGWRNPLYCRLERA